MAAVDRFLTRYDSPPRSLDQATYDYFTERCRWSRSMVHHGIEGIRIARAAGRPVFARKQGTMLEQWIAEFRRHNKERWQAKRRLEQRGALFDEAAE